MNYLGHIYLSGDDKWLMLGNLLGDFAKGSRFDRFDPRIHEGIRMHRKIDHFMDNHPVVLELSTALYAELPRIAPIAIDIVFDHLLAREWETYHPSILDEFLDDFFSFHLRQPDLILPEATRQLLYRLSDRKMIHYYQNPASIDKIANHLESRLSFDTQLPLARRVYEAKRNLFEDSFHTFMKDAVNIFPAQQSQI